MVVKHYSEGVAMAPQEAGAVGVKMRGLIGAAEGAPNFIMRHFTVEPGGETPYHTHSWEHEIYVLSGEGEVRQGGEFHRVAAGYTVYVSPNEEHQFVNRGDTPLELICLIPRQ